MPMPPSVMTPDQRGRPRPRWAIRLRWISLVPMLITHISEWRRPCSKRPLSMANGPTWAIRWTKLSINKQLKDQFNLIMDTSYALEMMSFRTDDHMEAVRAFVEKRKPQYTGR